MEDFLNLPKVSFIVITHNFEKFVCDCLRSIRNQTYKNFEIIVVDDVSKDSTVEKIENFIDENKDVEIKFIKNEKNLGQLASFIKGIEIAQGQFVCQIDGDDILFPEYCAIHIEAHLKTPVALTSCQGCEIDENNIIHCLLSAESSCVKKENIEIENKTYEEFQEYRQASGLNDVGANVRILDNDKFSFASWHWGPATSGMMRKAVCDLIMNVQNAKGLKITADKFLFSFCHLIGSSAIIDKSLFAYRRHNSNYSLANPLYGNKKYYKEKTQKNYIRNNKRVRSEIFSFLRENKEYFQEKFNRSNMYLIYKRIFLSFDKKFFKGVIRSLFIR